MLVQLRDNGFLRFERARSHVNSLTCDERKTDSVMVKISERFDTRRLPFPQARRGPFRTRDGKERRHGGDGKS